MGKKRKPIHPNDPLLYPDHPLPVTRRDFVRQGIIAGSGLAVGSGLLSLIANPKIGHAATQDIMNIAQAAGCPIEDSINQNIPVICFDLAGGANIAGSNVLVGMQNQLDTLSIDGYSKLGLPPGMVPDSSTGNFVDTQLGLAFHTDSQMLAGIMDKAPGIAGFVDGVVIPARSDNDTGNNPHNPMYGFAHADGIGAITRLVGSRNSESGGNSLSPLALINPTFRPIKVDRPSDVSGLVDVGNINAILDPTDVNAVMESVTRISRDKMDRVRTHASILREQAMENLVKCGYTDTVKLIENFGTANLDPAEDPDIVGPTGIFSNDPNDQQRGDEWNGPDRGEFRKTASIMKMVVEGYAAAGTVTMGGFDYHTGDRAVGERRDLRAGRCMGACLAYAQRKNKPLMIYCFSDGSVSSNGRIDNSQDGRGKGEWTSDNSSTAASFILVFHPSAGVVTASLNGNYRISRQLGQFTAGASVVRDSSPAAANVNLLTNTVILNYLALSGRVGRFAQMYSDLGLSHGLGAFDNYRFFNPLPPVPVTPPV